MSPYFLAGLTRTKMRRVFKYLSYLKELGTCIRYLRAVLLPLVALDAVPCALCLLGLAPPPLNRSLCDSSSANRLFQYVVPWAEYGSNCNEPGVVTLLLVGPHQPAVPPTSCTKHTPASEIGWASQSRCVLPVVRRVARDMTRNARQLGSIISIGYCERYVHIRTQFKNRHDPQGYLNLSE